MDGASLSGLGARILPGDVDLKFGFEAAAAKGDFVVLGFEGHEALFECFEITVDLISHKPDLDLHALLDTECTLTILHAYDQPRFIHACIAEIEKRSTGIRRTYYRCLLYTSPSPRDKRQSRMPSSA